MPCNGVAVATATVTNDIEADIRLRDAAIFCSAKLEEKFPNIFRGLIEAAKASTEQRSHYYRWRLAGSGRTFAIRKQPTGTATGNLVSSITCPYNEREMLSQALDNALQEYVGSLKQANIIKRLVQAGYKPSNLKRAANQAIVFNLEI